MNKKYSVLSFISLLLIIGLFVESTMSYFYTYVQANGQFKVSLNDSSEISEDPPTLSVKNLKIQNTGKDPIFVRVKAFAPDEKIIKISKESENAGWSENKEDGFYYYQEVLNSNEVKEIKFDIDKLPENYKPNEEYNIVLIYEATPALYSESNGWYANWNNIIDPDSSNVKEG